MRYVILVSRSSLIPPKRAAANFLGALVYNISVLANIPLSVFDLVDSSASVQGYRPLFNIGVHDIPFLIEDHKTLQRPGIEHEAVEEDGPGWIACTTDSILAMKDSLWDVLITMPPSFAGDAQEKVWPVIESPKGVPVKATQRDLRRFRSLKAGLARLASASAEESSPSSEAVPTTPRGRPSTSSGRSALPDPDPMLVGAAEKMVEPTTWTALAYSGFMWWASAGEQRRDEEMEEATHDASLLADLAPPMPQRSAGMPLPGDGGMIDSVLSLTARRNTSGASAGPADFVDEWARTELSIIAYFHRLSAQMLSVLADIVESCDDEDDDLTASSPDSTSPTDTLVQSDRGDDTSGAIRVGSETLARMGLDVWSQADADFINGIAVRYFARRAYIESKGVEVCGWKVC